ncbi:MAG: NAD(P)H-hydrate dehydratase [Labilithrix sp.]|nr:NAD(P)H-hydrate dehydratase [Labilithrix sp.]
MIPVLSRAQMRAFDAHAIDVCKVPSVVLMENAGRGAADVIEREILGGRAEGKRVVILCGAGNNGGDGFVVARHLVARGARVDAWLAGDAAKMTHDCKANHDAFVGLVGRVDAVVPSALDPLRVALAGADVVVDALFGTGLDRPLGDLFAGLVTFVNDARAKRVALDVPSGMNADTGAAMGAAVRADLTVTFGHLKLGHVTGPGAHLSGVVRVVDIGVPPTLRAEHAAGLSEARDVRALLRPRPVDAHKYRAGHVAILAGSQGKVGAALLAAHGALRGGAGAATIVTWPDAASSLESRVVEVMTARIGEEGAELIDQVEAAIANKRAVVMGPGFGTGERAQAAVRHVLCEYTGPIVADADALSMHAGAIEDFSAASGRAILTPHAGELARLLGTTSEEIESDRFSAARSAAARARAVVVLKGPYTIIASPDGRCVVNPTGNPALATAGAGDVLAGLTGALACSLPPFEAAWCGAYLHGAAGDAWRAKHGDRGLLAGEIADELPNVLRELVSASA